MRPKTPEQAQRIRARKTERKMAEIPGNQNNKGRSLAKILQDELDDAMKAWLKLKEVGADSSKARGQVRGMAISLAIILRPYDDRVSTAKLIEKASMERIRHGS